MIYRRLARRWAVLGRAVLRLLGVVPREIGRELRRKP